MDIWDALRIILRRWYAAVPVLLIFAVASYLSSGRVDAEYRARAHLILLGPNQELPDGATDIPAQQINAYLNPCSTCEVVGTAITLALGSGDARRAMEDDGWSSEYSLGMEKRTPLMFIEASSRDGDQAVGTVDVLIDRVSAELETRQADVNAPEQQRITATVLSQDTQPSGSFAAATRVKLALTAVGIAAAAVVAFLVEGAAYYLRRRNERDPDEWSRGANGAGSHSARHSAPRQAAPDFGVPKSAAAPRKEPSHPSHAHQGY